MTAVKWNDELLARARQLAHEGKTSREIGEALGLTTAAVQNAHKIYDLELTIKKGHWAAIPKWVPPALRSDYAATMRKTDEFEAAKRIRQMIREARP